MQKLKFPYGFLSYEINSIVRPLFALSIVAFHSRKFEQVMSGNSNFLLRIVIWHIFLAASNFLQKAIKEYKLFLHIFKTLNPVGSK
jgi:hypothetical protein